MPSIGLAKSNVLAEELVNEDYLLIVKVEVENLTLSNELFIYSYEGVTLIPLQPLFDALRFAIEVNPETQQANGWFIKESNAFSIDDNKIFINNKLQSSGDVCYLYSDDFDLYASLTCINSWFPIKGSLSFQDLTLKIKSSETLPLIAKLQRKKKRKKFVNTNNQSNLNPDQIVPDRYQWISSPILDVSLGYLVNEDQNIYDYSLYSAFDFLTFETRLTASQVQDSTNTGLLTFYKKPSTHDTTFLLGANDVSFGDIYGVSNDLISNGVGGVGFKVSADTDSRMSGFSSRIIEGFAPPGWEVELYRNDVQVDFLQVGQDGRYRFEQVSVQYGENIFDIKLYGPQGEFENRRESMNVGSDMLKRNAFTWSLAHYNQNEKMLGFSDDPTLSKPYVNTSFSMAYGVSDRISLGVSHIKHEYIDQQYEGPSQYTTYTILSALPMMNLSAEIALDDQNGKAINLALQGKILNYPSTFGIKKFDGLLSDRNAQAESMEYKLSSVGSFLLGDNAVQHAIKVKNENINEDTSNWDIENRFSFQFKNGLVTTQNGFYASNVTNTDILNGYVKYASRGGGEYRYRMQVDYFLLDESKISNLSFNLRKTFTSKIVATSDIIITPEDTDSNTLAFTYSHVFKYFKLNASSQFSQGNDYSLSMGIDFSLSTQPYALSNEKQVDYGRLSITSFLDENMNSTYDEGESLLSGIEFKGNNAWKGLTTNEQGEVVLPRLSTRSMNKLGLVGASLPDPFWRAKNKELFVYSHAGGNVNLDYPIYQTLEIEGQVNWVRNNKQQAAAGLLLQLINQDGKVESETYSEFDGVYVFTGIPPGDYQLIIPEDIQKSLKIDWPVGVSVSADSEETLIYVDDISIAR